MDSLFKNGTVFHGPEFCAADRSSSSGGRTQRAELSPPRRQDRKACRRVPH